MANAMVYLISTELKVHIKISPSCVSKRKKKKNPLKMVLSLFDLEHMFIRSHPLTCPGGFVPIP